MSNPIVGRWYWAKQHPRKLMDRHGTCMTIHGWTLTLAHHQFEPLTEAGFVSFLRGPLWLYQRSPSTTVEILDARIEEIWAQLRAEEEAEQKIAKMIGRLGEGVPSDPDWQSKVWQRIDGPWWKRAWRWFTGG